MALLTRQVVDERRATGTAREARERREVWSSPALPRIDVLQIRNTGKRCGMFHERFALSVARSGSGTVRYRGRQAEHDRDSLFLIEPGEAHSSPRAVGPLGWDVLFVDSAILQAVAEQRELRGPVHWRSLVVHDREAVTGFTQALSALRGADEPEATFALDSLLAQLLARHAETPGGMPLRPRDSVLVRRVRRRLHEQMSEKVALAALADDLRVSVCHLVRSFSAEMGLPPHRYLLQLRIERARAALKSGTSSTETAAQLGFADQSHFIRQFTKIVGVSPGRYAKAMR